MNLDWLTPSLVIAMFALWVSYSNYRRSNYPVLKLMECKHSYLSGSRENHGQMFAYVRVVVRNLGIPLHNIQMSLKFRGKNLSGTFSQSLSPDDGRAGREGQFAKGMVTDFVLKSYLFTPRDLGFLSQLEDPTRQAASFCLYSDGFLAWEQPLTPRLHWLKRVWNYLAGRVNHRLRRTYGINEMGQDIVRYYDLPTFSNPAWHVKEFWKATRKSLETTSPA